MPVIAALIAAVQSTLSHSAFLVCRQPFLKTEGKIVLGAAVEIKGIDRKGMNCDVAKVITDELDIDIHRVTVTADEGIFDGSIELRVHDRSDVKLIMDRIKKVDGIQEVMRIN